MPIYRDKERGCFVFEFDRRIDGARVRARKRLPKTWNQARADEFDREQCAKLYAQANGLKTESRLIDDAVALYLTERVPNLKSGMNTARELALIEPFYRGRPMSALADVCKAISIKGSKGKKPLAPATIRARIRYLTAACRWAWKNHAYGDSDPAARVMTPTVQNERQLYLSRAQMLAVAKGTKNKMARMAVRIAFYSGMRLDEIRRAKLRDGMWHLSVTKNGKPRVVPVHPKVAVCARHFKAPARITIQVNVRKAFQAVGLEGAHFHDLRHSAASAMVNSGVDLYTVGAVLGHMDPRSTARYSHLATGTLAEAVGKIGQKNPPAKLRRVA